jgi:2-dehydro-3-deoxyphosphogluconate aldolase/(4S)-4-hydroxy-2-oxoglutarate aldolase
MMPTGGVTLETVSQYRKAGAAAYGLGAALYDKTQVKTANWKWVAEQIQSFRKALS